MNGTWDASCPGCGAAWGALHKPECSKAGPSANLAIILAGLRNRALAETGEKK